ncbi:MAG: anthranilate phosphoribosyltransferase [Haliscomenobacter sp.]|nr:anthranilate phosphoribosyltransferase [Haliscomenobacter sp.]MBK8879235.1 anthranilate phosphoribosyltransferase [Haliscomenobacter sp.]
MKNILSRLYEHDKLSRAEAKAILVGIAENHFNEIQVAAFTTVYNMRPITLSELQGFRDALLELCIPLDLQGVDTIDVVGTGGDGKNTFNISTASCMVVAGAGYKVSKHGSYGVSSAVGSSDVLLQLGYKFTNDQDTLRRQLDTANMCFLHAPLFHPALKAVVPVRRQLGTKTFFNMLGPLVNPVQPRFQLFGTFSMELLRMYQYIMQQSGRRFAIVYALDGYDEVSLTGDFKICTNDSERILSPRELGFALVKQSDLHGGDTAQEAGDIFLQVLQDKATPAQKNAVLANAGLAIQVVRPERSLEDCIAEARESVESGRAYQLLRKLLEISA